MSPGNAATAIRAIGFSSRIAAEVSAGRMPTFVQTQMLSRFMDANLPKIDFSHPVAIRRRYIVPSYTSLVRALERLNPLLDSNTTTKRSAAKPDA